MKLEVFFEKFDQFADAPYAVEKMRELVLDLAVQGKLANQDPDDESAVDLLQRLIKFKSANPLIGRSGRSKEAPLEVEVNVDALPANWVNTTIGEVLYVIRGASPRPKGDPKYFSQTRTPYHWVKISDIRKHGHNGRLMDTDEFLTEAGMRKSVLLPKGTLVLTNSATIGVPIVLGIEGCCIHDGYLAFPNFPHELLSQKFLLYLFHTLKKHAERHARGLAQLNLNTELVRSFPFGLPPLAEQKRIVGKVDALMVMCDRLALQQQERETRHVALARASLARFAAAPNPGSLSFLFHQSYDITPTDLRKSILTLAVQGKLVPQDSNDEPASKLVARVAGEKLRLLQTKVIKSEAPLDPISDKEALFPIPNTWIWLRAGDLCRPISSGSTPDQSVFNASEGIPYLKVYNIRNQAVDFDYKRQFISVSHHAERMKRSKLIPGDVIMNIVGPPLGKVAIIPDAFPEWNCNQAIAFFRPIFPAFAPYLYTFLKEGSFLQNIELIGTAGQDNISVTKCKFIPIPIPPIAEQRRIVAKVEQLMPLVDELEVRLAESRTVAANLLSAVVAEIATQAAK